MTAAGGAYLARTGKPRRDRRRGGSDTQPGLLANTRTWLTVLTDRTWWSLPAEDRFAYRSGVALGQWTNRQVRRSGLCVACWERESSTDVRPCEGGNCRAFAELLTALTDHPRIPGAGQTPPTEGDQMT
ncbi:hypothetical protein Srufu_079230 (plasmid) [Streptomyces libani subsp. rufus]|nr:hypothetical protein Srufu_079230 [Streptomyces libani subsp. rufus]